MREAVFNFRLNQHPVLQQANKLMDDKNKFELELIRLGGKPDNARIFFGKNYRRM